MSVNESVHRFGPSRSLIGVLTEPAGGAAGRDAILLLNSGIVHRVGPNRLYVAIARRLAPRGLAALRFDFSGIGDSPARRDATSFDRSALDETRAAMEYLRASRGHDRFLLIGICSGADAALAAGAGDRRVTGILAINARRYGIADGLFGEVQQRALARHYRRIALSRSFGAHSVRKLTAGRMDWRAIWRAVASQRPRPPPLRAGGACDGLERLLRQGTALYCLHSEADEGLDHFHVVMGGELRRLRSLPGFRFEVLEGTDHTFTMRWSQAALLERIERWWDERSQLLLPVAGGGIPIDV